jgi:Trypsin-like peptidase domain/MAP3K TRAFs-binding domain
MDWDPKKSIEDLTKKIEAFDKQGAAALCENLIAYISQNDPYPADDAASILKLLRKKRMFKLMQTVADALIISGQDAPEVRRQYAQCLIDQGNMTAALSVLNGLITDTQNNPVENAEARGLKGRLYKQLYINAKKPPNARNRRHMERAVRSYFEVYESSPDEHLWHGINAVALLMRARRDGFDLEGFPAPEKLAEDILAVIKKKDANEAAKYWDFATAAEACVALNKTEEAVSWIGKYLKANYADAFELGSTLRQFEEVWQLEITSEPGQLILPPLRAELLKREGGGLDLSVQDLRPENQEQPLDKKNYEKVFGSDSFQTLEWYQRGLTRCRAVARIGRVASQGHGTGFLIKGSELNKNYGSELLLLTNAHVVSNDPKIIGDYGSLLPNEAIVTFEALDKKVYKVKKLLWTSPPYELDATILQLDQAVNDPDIYPLAEVLPIIETSARVYIIGHPAGGTLSFSLQDNALLAHKDPPGKIHYRTPTVGGSSGSPVFNRNWDLIGLHHSGDTTMPMLDGTGTYQANEGIWIRAIIKAIAESSPPKLSNEAKKPAKGAAAKAAKKATKKAAKAKGKNR